MLALCFAVVCYGLDQFERERERSCSHDKLTLQNDALQSCLFSLHGNKSISIALVSYFTSNILDYAKYSYSINRAFAAYGCYGYQLFSPMFNDPMYEPIDHRWARVKLLDSLLAKQGNCTNHSLCNAGDTITYYVWFDADLIFLNFELKFHEIINLHSNASIIISAERHAETGVANTGELILTFHFNLHFLS